jgi:hypothetical protein
MSRPRRVYGPDSDASSGADRRVSVVNLEPHLGERRNRSPQGLRPQIALIVEALARAAARREYRRAMEAAARPKAEGAGK